MHVEQRERLKEQIVELDRLIIMSSDPLKSKQIKIFLEKELGLKVELSLKMHLDLLSLHLLDLLHNLESTKRENAELEKLLGINQDKGKGKP